MSEQWCDQVGQAADEVADAGKTQKYLDIEYGDMPKPAKTEKFVLSSIYKKGRFCIMHDLWPSNSARPTNSEQVTIFRTKL